MSAFNRTEKDDEWPKGDDLAIREQLTQRGFRVLVTLAGAAAGLYVMLTGGQGLIFFGLFVGICGIYQLWHFITRAARANGATRAELARNPPEARGGAGDADKTDGYIWSE